MDARLFTTLGKTPLKSEKTFILYWHTGHQYDPVEFLNRNKDALLEVKDDCIHRTLAGLARAEPIRKKQSMYGFPYVVEVNLSLSETNALMRAKNLNDFAASVGKVHYIFSIERMSDPSKTVSVKFANGKFVNSTLAPSMKK